MTIRLATQLDLEQIKAIAIAAYSMYVERIGKVPAPMVADFSASIENGSLYVIEGESRIDGFVVFYPRQDCIHLENVAVNPGTQGKGVGKALIRFVEDEARAAGFQEVELYTNARMTENLGIYPRLGYMQFDRRFEDGFDRVYFKKKL